MACNYCVYGKFCCPGNSCFCCCPCNYTRPSFIKTRLRRRRIITSDNCGCDDDVISVGRPRHRVVKVERRPRERVEVEEVQDPVTLRCVEVPSVTAVVSPPVIEERPRRLNVTVTGRPSGAGVRQCNPVDLPLVHCPVVRPPPPQHISEIRFMRKNDAATCRPTISYQGVVQSGGYNTCGGGGAFNFTVSGAPCDGASRRYRGSHHVNPAAPIGNIQIVPNNSSFQGGQCFTSGGGGGGGGGGLTFNFGLEGGSGGGNSLYPSLSGGGGRGGSAEFIIEPSGQGGFTSYPSLPDFYD